MAEAVSRPAWADIDTGAITGNVEALRALVAPAAVCAVVKANGYGHGAVAAANASLAGGATWLAVAFVEEGVALRDEKIDAPILLLSEPPADAMTTVVRHRLTPTLYTRRGVTAAVAAGADAAHVKVDSGMHRVGADPNDVIDIVTAVIESGMRLGGLWTHFAVADEPDKDATTKEQLRRLDVVRSELDGLGIRPDIVHASNSAGAIAHSDARLDLVRCGIAIYGIAPSPELAGRVALTPAMSVRAEVTHVRRIGSGQGVSYGHRFVADAPTTIATVPIGYADGVPRRLGLDGAPVLIGGRRRPMAGVVTMDQLMVDCGDDDVSVGDEVVLIGSQGDDEITADEWADRLGTISYEVVCGIGPRVQRRYH
ncbi:MAG: alanine racemase [Actinobacteria bacterium]|nr:alanine racemase [Actinomycetota bacterium]